MMTSPNGFASADVARKAEADAKDADARRVAMINLHIAGRKEFGRSWDTERGYYIFASTGGRTKSAKEASTVELASALRMIERRIEKADQAAWDREHQPLPDVRWYLDENGDMPFSAPRS